MHKMLQRYTFILIALVSFLLPAYSYAQGLLETSAKQAIMLDFDTGMVLYEKNADERMPTSSMSKVMTMYVVFEALQEGRLNLEDTLLVSEKAWRKGGSKMFVEVDKRVKVEDLVRGVIIQSGNDSAIVLAEGMAGTEAAFAEALNKEAQELGMVNSNFRNASGWPDSNHYSTARDLATLGRALVQNFPEYYGYYSEKEYTYNNIRQRNRNPLLYRDIGADGIKTGHTNAGGYGLIGSGKRNGRRVILVVNGLEDERARAQESAKIMDYGLKGFENIHLFDDGEIIDMADIVMGRDAQVPLVLDDDLAITVPSLNRSDLRVELEYNEPLIAPVEQGDRVGSLKITIPRLKPIEVPVYASQSVARKGFISETFSKATLFLLGHRSSQD